MIYETFREAVKNIWSNKFRTVLTMLGIIIGVTAVIVIVGLGNGMTQSIKDSFSEMGTNVLSVQITGRGSRTVTVQQSTISWTATRRCSLACRPPPRWTAP